MARSLSRQFSSTPRAGLHLAPEHLVHMGLVLLTLPSKPGEHVGIHAKTHQLLDWPVKAPHLNAGRPRPSLRRIGKVDLRIGTVREPLEFPALLVSERSSKERGRWDSPFLPR